MAGIRLGDITWVEAEKRLTADTVVAIPLGAAAKEHGPHLLLENDARLAEYFAARVLERTDVVMAPLVGFHFYPSFVDYPGSITLRFDTARDLLVDICRSLARFGPRRFYVVNTGVSTMRPLRASAEVLAGDGVALRYTDFLGLVEPVAREIGEQERGTHADEIETSMMLHIAPDTVDMTRAVKDCQPGTRGPFTREPRDEGIYSASGVWGDATLASRDKGRRVVEAIVAGMIRDIAALREVDPGTLQG